MDIFHLSICVCKNSFKKKISPNKSKIKIEEQKSKDRFAQVVV
tara:strand:+ start:500 stop:628 length:129 start_codon:yes stop_codon:yes gene_type:complete